MKTIQYTILSAFSFILLFSSCTKDEEVKDVAGDETPVSLTGLSVRNDGVNGSNIYLKAFLGGGPPIVFINETLITFADNLSSTPEDVIFPLSTPYYPVGGAYIDFYAYSGKLQDDKMVVLAGNNSSYDAVLSNSGIDVNNIVSPEGSGTRGNSLVPAKTLYFRHVMTQLIVDIKVNSSELPDTVSPAPKSIQFTMDGVAAKGLYPIRGLSPVIGSESSYADTAHSSSGNYTIVAGMNYLVPNGVNLTGRHLNSLIIDNYTATAADLANFTIQPVSGPSSDLLLMPGYAYKLTFTVSRLKVTGATIRLIPWQPIELNTDDVEYESYPLKVSLGSSYANSAEDEVTKVVLHTNNNRIYVGESEGNTDTIPFVTLPTGNVVRADLYTAKGLLLSTPVTNEYNYAGNTGTLNIPNLSVGGMLPENPASPYNSISNPYLITTPLQFMNVNKALTASYKQGINIDMNLVDTTNFNGFGSFSGTYDGNGHWIATFRVKGTGMFASNSGVLKNIRIYSGIIDATGEAVAGGICGINTGTIVGCINEARIINSPNTAGGICGTNSGLLLASINTGNIEAGTIVGGICGNNTNIAEGAIAACINTGSLYKSATTIGGICGTATASTDTVIRTSFWLVGTGAQYIGGSENTVGSGSVVLFDCSVLDPPKLRNGLDVGETEDRRVINRLNHEISRYTQWNPSYHYILDRVQTGSTWPMPVKF